MRCSYSLSWRVPGELFDRAFWDLSIESLYGRRCMTSARLLVTWHTTAYLCMSLSMMMHHRSVNCTPLTVILLPIMTTSALLMVVLHALLISSLVKSAMRGAIRARVRKALSSLSPRRAIRKSILRSLHWISIWWALLDSRRAPCDMTYNGLSRHEFICDDAPPIC